MERESFWRWAGRAGTDMRGSVHVGCAGPAADKWSSERLTVGRQLGVQEGKKTSRSRPKCASVYIRNGSALFRFSVIILYFFLSEKKLTYFKMLINLTETS